MNSELFIQKRPIRHQEGFKLKFNSKDVSEQVDRINCVVVFHIDYDNIENICGIVLCCDIKMGKRLII